jgi:hypothetical protein
MTSHSSSIYLALNIFRGGQALFRAASPPVSPRGRRQKGKAFHKEIKPDSCQAHKFLSRKFKMTFSDKMRNESTLVLKKMTEIMFYFRLRLLVEGWTLGYQIQLERKKSVQTEASCAS